MRIVAVMAFGVLLWQRQGSSKTALTDGAGINIMPLRAVLVESVLSYRGAATPSRRA